MGAPQIIYIVLLALGVGIAWNNHGKATTTNFWATLVSTAITVGLLIWGGFFK